MKDGLNIIFGRQIIHAHCSKYTENYGCGRIVMKERKDASTPYNIYFLMKDEETDTPISLPPSINGGKRKRSRRARHRKQRSRKHRTRK